MTAHLDGRAQVERMRELYRPPDPEHDDAPPVARRGVEEAQGRATDLHRHDIASPRRPAPGSIRARVLAELLAGRSLTSLEAWRDLGTSRLAADVYELRRMGWPIIATDTPVECREGRSARVATYRMGGSP